MKIFTQIALATLIGSAGASADTEMPKRYDIRSGKILYEIRGGGDIMGMVKTKTFGKKRLIFDDFGAREIVELSKVEKETAGGKSKVKKEHTLRYTNGAILYDVSFKRKKIVRMNNPGLAAGVLLGGGQSMSKAGEAMLRKMGGKKIGSDTVLGHTCDVWSLMGAKQCIYKGVVLKVETDIMGVKSTEVAVKAQFNLSLDKEVFTLPDYPISDRRGRTLNVDRSQLDALDARETEKRLTQTAEGASAVKAAMEAAAKAGYNKNGKTRLNQNQKDAMANAMLPMMKQQFLKQVTPMRRMRDCLRRADTRKQAIACGRKYGSDFDPSDVPPQWNAATKRQTLQEMNQYLDTIVPCVRNAQTMQQVQSCMPR
jgi:hypothetical protein